MPMPSTHQDFISHVGSQAQQLLDMYSLLKQADILWYGIGDYDDLITQESIDSIPSFQETGLTVSALGEAVYSLKLVLLTIEERMVPLTIAAQLK